MKIKSLFFLLLPVVFLLTSACFQEIIEDSNKWKKDISNLPVEEILITESDYQLITINGEDMHTKIRVFYTDNYMFDPLPYRKFAIGSHAFDSRVEGGVANSTINGQPMCGDQRQNCDFKEFRPNGIWYITGNRKATGDFEWEFINISATKKFKVKVTNMPSQTTISSYDSFFSNKKDNLITIKKNAETDSVLVELIVFPKEIANGNFPSFWSRSAYRFRPEIDGNTLVIKKGDLLSSPISPKDTAFLNVATIKRSVNIIDNEDVGFTYQINNLVPITLDREP